MRSDGRSDGRSDAGAPFRSALAATLYFKAPVSSAIILFMTLSLFSNNASTAKQRLLH